MLNWYRFVLMTALFIAGSVGGAFACESPYWDPAWAEKPVQTRANCAFDRGGPNQDSDITGGPTQPLANGLFYQVIRNHHVCTIQDSLLVVDCANRRLILISSVEHPRGSIGTVSEPERLIENILRPRGAIRLNQNATLERLQAIAEREDYPYTLSADGSFFAGMERRKRFDPFCACR